MTLKEHTCVFRQWPRYVKSSVLSDDARLFFSTHSNNDKTQIDREHAEALDAISVRNKRLDRQCQCPRSTHTLRTSSHSKRCTIVPRFTHSRTHSYTDIHLDARARRRRGSNKQPSDDQPTSSTSWDASCSPSVKSWTRAGDRLPLCHGLNTVVLVISVF